MLLALLVCVHTLAADDLAPRVDVLRMHHERLGAITVTPDLETEKAEKLETLRVKLEQGVSSEEAFKQLYLEMDAVRSWLWEHSAERPKTATGELTEGPGEWTLKTDALTVRVNRSDGSMQVDTPATSWTFLPCDDKDIELQGSSISLTSAANITAEEFRTGYSMGAIYTLSGFPEAAGLELRLTVNIIGSEIVFEVAAVDAGVPIRSIRWPKPLETGNTASDFAVIPNMQGMLLPGNSTQEFHESSLCNSRSLYMPWWGQIRDGRGVQTILETSDDAGAQYDHPSGGPTRIQPRWYASLESMRYLRTVRYVFSDDCTYVHMAKRYRRYVEETGRLVTLAEKRVRTPNLDEVIGRPVIHPGALYHFVQEASLFNKERIEANHSLSTFDQLADSLRKLKAAGIEDAYVHLDGWGFYGYDNAHPDVLPPGEEQGGWDGLRRFADTCEELGYLFAVHDQYRDFYLNAASFDDRLAAYRFDGTREETSTWCGGPQTILNPRFAPEYVRRNHDLFAANGVKVKGAYLDVFSVVPLEESSEKAHPITRSDCARYRAECFDLLRARGYVVSSEEPTDYLLPHLDLVHHGPYGTYPHYGGGGARGIPVPLWNLVYHDCLLLPWEMGEDGGWGIPKGDAAWLHCFLNAGMPYVWPGADETMVARVKEACALNQRLATQDMTNHEFLGEGYRKQRSTYADGTTVTVDFDAKTCEIVPGA
ncbi:MAG: hypothetical protein IT364_02060 [Candidatus Hydrogenedentes bacterium]|nr:hypothetical protein [Candidatus Hydrogenedentota bacterium]